MNWKRFYAEELAGDAGRRAVAEALRKHGTGDPVLVRLLLRGGVASFPHVRLRDSADPLARVATSILATGARRVVALGVLHGGTLPEPFRGEMAELNRGGSPRADELFARLGGAFPEDADIVANEFSLDLFAAVLAAAAGELGVAPPSVARVFVGPTRDPRGSFATATLVADAVRPLLGDDTVCVTTGDLVHCGNAYAPPEEVAAMPRGAELAASLRRRIDAMHEAALERGGFEEAFAAASALRSDQRNLLPVIAELLGRGASAEVLSFELSDYAAINGVPPPSFVASALVAFAPA